MELVREVEGRAREDRRRHERGGKREASPQEQGQRRDEPDDRQRELVAEVRLPDLELCREGEPDDERVAQALNPRNAPPPVLQTGHEAASSGKRARSELTPSPRRVASIVPSYNASRSRIAASSIGPSPPAPVNTRPSSSISISSASRRQRSRTSTRVTPSRPRA